MRLSPGDHRLGYTMDYSKGGGYQGFEFAYAADDWYEIVVDADVSTGAAKIRLHAVYENDVLKSEKKEKAEEMSSIGLPTDRDNEGGVGAAPDTVPKSLVFRDEDWRRLNVQGTTLEESCGTNPYLSMYVKARFDKQIVVKSVVREGSSIWSSQ